MFRNSNIDGEFRMEKKNKCWKKFGISSFVLINFMLFYYPILAQEKEYCRQVSFLKYDIVMKGFENHQKEIHFFKSVKPEILGKLIYYDKVVCIESFCPGNIYRKIHLSVDAEYRCNRNT